MHPTSPTTSIDSSSSTLLSDQDEMNCSELFQQICTSCKAYRTRLFNTISDKQRIKEYLQLSIKCNPFRHDPFTSDELLYWGMSRSSPYDPAGSAFGPDVDMEAWSAWIDNELSWMMRHKPQVLDILVGLAKEESTYSADAFTLCEYLEACNSLS